MLWPLVVIISLASASAHSTCGEVTVHTQADELQLTGVFTLDLWEKDHHGRSIFYNDRFHDHRLAYQVKTERRNLRGTQAGAAKNSPQMEAAGRCEGREGTWYFSTIDSEGNEIRISVDDCAEHPVDITNDQWMVSYPGCTTCPRAQYIESSVAITCSQDGEGPLEKLDTEIVRLLLDMGDNDYSFSYEPDIAFSYSYMNDAEILRRLEMMKTGHDFSYSYSYSFAYSV